MAHVSLWLTRSLWLCGALATVGACAPHQSPSADTSRQNSVTHKDYASTVRSRNLGRYCWADYGPGLPYSTLVRHGGIFHLAAQWPWDALAASSYLSASPDGRWFAAATRYAVRDRSAMVVSAKGDLAWRVELPHEKLIGAVAADEDGGAVAVLVAPAPYFARSPTIVKLSSRGGATEWSRELKTGPTGTVPMWVRAAASRRAACAATSFNVVCFDPFGTELVRDHLECGAAPAMLVRPADIVTSCLSWGKSQGLTTESVQEAGSRLWSSKLGHGVVDASDIIQVGEDVAVLVVVAFHGEIRAGECERGTAIRSGQAGVVLIGPGGRCRLSHVIGPATLQEYRFLPSEGHVDVSLVPRETPSWSQNDTRNPFWLNGHCERGHVYELYSLSFTGTVGTR